MNWKLSPSDLTFLYAECPRCYYLKIHGVVQRPRTPMPKIFTVIDRAMKAFLEGRRTEEIGIGMPRGLFELSDKWVESVPFRISGCTSTCSFRGIFDNVFLLDAGGRGLADLKTCHRRDEHIPLYGRQLHAYTWSLESPAPNALHLSPIEKMGLLVYEPTMFFRAFCSGSLIGPMEWIDVPRDDRGFAAFLQDVVRLLDSPTPPPAAPDCAWCRYRTALDRTVDILRNG